MRHTLVGCLILASCSGGGPATEDTDEPAVVFPRPVVTLVAPLADAMVTGPDVTLTLTVEDFELTGKSDVVRHVAPLRTWAWSWLTPAAYAHGTNEAPNGYIAVRVDGVLTAELDTTTTTLTGLAAGPHTVEVELLYPDADAFYPAVFDAVTFTVTVP